MSVAIERDVSGLFRFDHRDGEPCWRRPGWRIPRATSVVDGEAVESVAPGRYTVESCGPEDLIGPDGEGIVTTVEVASGEERVVVLTVPPG